MPFAGAGATKVPAGPEWLHEVKYDGYRQRVERDGDRVRLITRGGFDWTKRYPWIVEAARKIRQKRFVLDGEAVVLGVDGISDFERCTLASTPRRCSSATSRFSSRAMTICASCRCTCARPTLSGYWHVDPRAFSSIRSSVVRSALISSLRLGLEGLVSKRRDRPYRDGT